MAAVIKGKQISWGIPAAAVTAGTSLFTAVGIVESFEIDPGGGTTEIGDEDDDIVTRIDHAAVNKISMTVICTSSTTKPAKGAEITGSTLGTLDGIAFGTGRIFVDTAKVTYNRAGEKKIAMTASHYPVMAADA